MNVPAGSLNAHNCDISSTKGCGVIGMNSRSPSNLLHSLPTPSQFSEPKTQTDFFRIFCSAVVLRSCNVIMAGEAVDHVEPWHVLWLRFCFVRVWRQPLKGTVFDSSITAIVAVSAQQSCSMQVSVMHCNRLC
jgi:hypothetical protein